MLTNKGTRLNIFILLMVVAIAGTAAGQTIYVDAGATGTPDGSSWANAYLSLQDALAAVAEGATILVAEGTYTPDQGGGQTPGDRYATFQLISGVAIYGGFPSGGCPWEDRDPIAYETILSGDLNADDVQVLVTELLSEPTRGENSYHVVTGNHTDATAIIEGFTITAGNANGLYPIYWGGGMYNNNGSPTVTNCAFRGNSASEFGGGMFNRYSISILTNCTFSANSASTLGGGMKNEYGSPTVTNCAFRGNCARFGGGMELYSDEARLTNCTFSGNSASEAGGGLYINNNNNASPTVMTNCTFSGNSASAYGGGMFIRNNSSPVLTNCSFARNSANYGNGLACSYDSWSFPNTIKLTNCILWDGGDEIYDRDGGSTINITFSDVQGGGSDPGGNNIDAAPLFVDADGFDDIVGTADDNLRLSPGSPCIDAGDNSAVPALVVTDLDGNPRFVDCPDIPDTGNGAPPIVDIGAYEVIIAPVIQVVIDIKPGSYPNPINLGSYGLIPVAILSSEDFDATTVDPESVELAGAGVAVRGKSNKYMAHQEDVNGDGLVDLMAQVATENLDPDSFQDGFAILTGNLFEEFGGTLIEGADEITIVPQE